jgi:hypothetical protein
MRAGRATFLHKTPNAAIWTGCVVLVLAVAGYALLPARTPLQVELLDVTGYTDDVKVWMPLRVTLGLTNTGRELLTIRRIHVEPDFAGFSETFNVQTYELNPALVIEPGSSLSYQTGVTLLNAAQLSDGAHDLLLRVRIEQNGDDATYDFPAAFEQSRQPSRRTLKF